MRRGESNYAASFLIATGKTPISKERATASAKVKKGLCKNRIVFPSR
jgi:hypothetical protein